LDVFSIHEIKEEKGYTVITFNNGKEPKYSKESYDFLIKLVNETIIRVRGISYV
jgi:hypothetical protein